MRIKEENINSKLVHYNTIANAFKVVDISSPVFLTVSPDENSVDASHSITEPSKDLIKLMENNSYEGIIWKEMDKLEDRICLVKDKNQTYGYLKITSFFDEKKTAKEVAEKIHPEDMVPADMSILELIPLLRKKYFFFVLDKNTINDVVMFSDLDKLPVKLILFSLFLHLESELIEVLTQDEKKASIHILNLKKEKPNRYQKAWNLCSQKYGNNINSKNLILCTNFIDKKIMLLRDFTLYQKLFESSEKSDHFFNILEKVRNQIAHSDSILAVLKNPKQFSEFINELRTKILLIKSINQMGSS